MLRWRRNRRPKEQAPKDGDSLAGNSSLTLLPPRLILSMSDPVTLDTLVVLPADVVMDASPAAPESPLVASTSSLPLDSPSLPLRAPSPPTAPEPTAMELEAAATKKRKMAALADENKKRNRRMFGLVTSTLAQAKDQTKKVLGASQKRVDLESRLADKLKKEREEMEEKRLREKSTKDLKFGVVRKEEELATAEAIVRLLFLDETRWERKLMR